jgi:hypothetical protein
VGIAVRLTLKYVGTSYERRDGFASATNSAHRILSA